MLSIIRLVAHSSQAVPRSWVQKKQDSSLLNWTRWREIALSPPV